MSPTAHGSSNGMIEKGRNYLLFDGDCGICTWLATNAAPVVDRAGRYTITPYFSIPEEELKRHGFDYESCTRQIYVVTDRGRVRGGAFALNSFMLSSFPWSIVAALCIALPPLLLLEINGYKLVAVNRERISRMFGLNACRVR